MKRLAFNGGEISPNMSLRSDIDTYARSCSEITNWDINPCGGITRRPGISLLTTALPSSSILIPYHYTDKHTYLIELSTNTLRIFDASTAQLRATITDPDTWSYTTLDRISWQQLNTILLITSPDCQPMALRLTDNNTFTYTPYTFKNPPWANTTLRDTPITLTPSDRAHTYTPTFDPTETDTESSYDPDDTLRASYYTPRTEAHATSAELRNGTWHTYRLDLADSALTSETTIKQGDKIAILTTLAYEHYICTYPFTPAEDLTAGLTSPANYMAGDYPRFAHADNLTDFDTATTITELNETTTFKKGDKIRVATGYWQLYTAIRTFNGATDHIPGNNLPHQYPNHFILGIPIGNAIPCGGTWSFQCSGSWYGSYEIRRSYDSADLTASWETIGESASYIGSPENNIITGDESEEECNLRLYLTSIRYMGSNLAAGWPSDSCVNRLIVSSYKHNMQLTADLDLYLHDTSPIKIPLTAPLTTKDWSWSAFNPRYGYPALAAIHESRLWLASTTAQPQTLWASQTDDLNNFATGTQDTAALSLTMATTTQNPISWLLSRGEVIMLGTSDAEWTIASSTPSSITPTTARISNHGNIGSAPIPALRATDRVLYCERGAGRIYEYAYSYEAAAYHSRDLTTFADHIATSAGGITSSTLQRKPYTRALFTLANGTLALMTYNPHHTVNAWHRYTTNGTIQAICALPNGNNPDNIYLITLRDNTRYLERLTHGTYTDHHPNGNTSYTSTITTTAFSAPDANDNKQLRPTLHAFLTTTTPASAITATTADNTLAPPNIRGNLKPGWNKLHTLAHWTDRPNITIQITGPHPCEILALQIQ